MKSIKKSSLFEGDIDFDCIHCIYSNLANLLHRVVERPEEGPPYQDRQNPYR